MPTRTPSLELIRAILGSEDDALPGQRYQDPKIQTRSDVKRPFYYIQPYVPELTPQGLVRRKKKIALGFVDEMSMRKAKSAKEQYMSTINAQKFIAQSQVPFSELLKRFNEIRLPQLGVATRNKYTSHIDNHIEPAFKLLRMCDIDRPTVEAWLNQCAVGYTIEIEPGVTKTHKPLGHWTLLDLRNILSAIFSKAEEWKLWAGDNPCEHLKVGGVAEIREKKIPNSDGLNAFLTAIAETAIMPAEGARLMVITAVTTGLRVSEVLGLQPRDIDPAAKTLEVRRRWHRGSVAEPKSKASKRIRKIDGLADALLAYGRGKGEEEFIFGRLSNEGNPPDDRDLQQHVFRPAAEAVHIYSPGFGMHTFRRLNITWRQTIGGASVFEAQKAAGHAQPSTTWMYTVLDGEREAAQVEKLWGEVKGGVQ
jgi:integrase